MCARAALASNDRTPLCRHADNAHYVRLPRFESPATEVLGRYADRMSSPRLPRDRGRTASIVLSSIALATLTFVLLWTFGLNATLSGASSMAVILPIVVFWCSSVVFGIAGFIALGLGVTASRPTLPSLLAVGVLLEILVGLLLISRL